MAPASHRSGFMCVGKRREESQLIYAWLDHPANLECWTSWWTFWKDWLFYLCQKCYGQRNACQSNLLVFSVWSMGCIVYLHPNFCIETPILSTLEFNIPWSLQKICSKISVGAKHFWMLRSFEQRKCLHMPCAYFLYSRLVTMLNPTHTVCWWVFYYVL